MPPQEDAQATETSAEGTRPRLRSWEWAAQKHAAKDAGETGRVHRALERLPEKVPDHGNAQQLRQDGSRCDRHADERRCDAKRTTEAGLQYPMRRRCRIHHMGNGWTVTDRYDDAHPVPRRFSCAYEGALCQGHCRGWL